LPIEAAQIVDVLLATDPMYDLPRTGWLLRGVASPESIAAHSWGTALTAMLLTRQLRDDGEEVDGERVLQMALLHDVAEAATGDFPMPQKTAELSEALHRLEAQVAAAILPTEHAALWAEAETGETLEARIVKAADKLQMMAKALVYEARRGARLGEFWDNTKNFRTMGLERAEELFAEMRRRRVELKGSVT
jgi:putative hydrolase of HD superfamily